VSANRFKYVTTTKPTAIDAFLHRPFYFYLLKAIRMNMTHFFLLIISVLFLSFGQILFKLAAKEFPSTISFETLFIFLVNKYFFIAICLYATASFLWVWALNSLPLSSAYPFMALAFIIVPILSYLILGEQLTSSILIGSVVIIVGLIISVK